MTRDDVAGVIIDRILTREGGIDDIGDGAGVTAFGQTPRWLRTYGFSTPSTPDEARANYRTWLVRTRLIGLCDQLDSLPDVVIDFAVNANEHVATAALQAALGIHRDALYGPETQDAVDGCDRRRIAAAVLAEKIRYRGDLVTGNPVKFARWARGWLRRDAAQISGLVE